MGISPKDKAVVLRQFLAEVQRWNDWAGKDGTLSKQWENVRDAYQESMTQLRLARLDDDLDRLWTFVGQNHTAISGIARTVSSNESSKSLVEFQQSMNLESQPKDFEDAKTRLMQRFGDQIDGISSISNELAEIGTAGGAAKEDVRTLSAA